MPSTREIRRRIRSVKNTAQITRAMEMVAASRMRRAQQAVEASRPFAEHIRQMLSDLGRVALKGGGPRHPLLEDREVHNVAIVLITSDRGLAGAFNSNVIRTTVSFMRSEVSAPTKIIAVGRRGRDYMRRFGHEIVGELINIGDLPREDAILPAGRQVVEMFTKGEADQVYLAYNEYVSTLTNRPRLVRLIPVEPPEDTGADEGKRPFDYIYEPSAEELLNALLPRYIEVQLYQALLESKASEHSSRMVTMRNATDNANELADDLNLAYNKLRQATITKEIIEIASGAEALRQAR